MKGVPGKRRGAQGSKVDPAFCGGNGFGAWHRPTVHDDVAAARFSGVRADEQILQTIPVYRVRGGDTASLPVTVEEVDWNLEAVTSRPRGAS